MVAPLHLGQLTGGFFLVCLLLAPAVLELTVLMIWSIRLTKVVAGRARSAPGAAAKLRYSAPALVAWSWPVILILAGTSRQPLTLPGEFLLPLTAPLAGEWLAARCRPPAGQN